MALFPQFNESKYLQYKKIEDVPEEEIEEINSRLKKTTSESPIVSIIIAAWNEEINLIGTIDTLSKQESSFPFEIIVVNNNSTDNTAVTLNKLSVRQLFQPIQGCGPAKQLGLTHAKGRYILSADADCFYPTTWVENMVKELSKEGVSCVYGNYRFITENIQQKIGMLLYENARIFISQIRHIKRPFLNCLGLNMGFIREYAVKIGYIEKNIRGEDGRLAYSLMQYGTISRVYNKRTTTWTGYRTLVRKGSLLTAFCDRLLKEFRNISSYTKKIEDHDPKKTTSEYNPSEYKN